MSAWASELVVRMSIDLGLIGAGLGGLFFTPATVLPPVFAEFEWLDVRTPGVGDVVQYVDPIDGDNANDGLTFSTPKLTWYGPTGAMAQTPTIVYVKQGTTYSRVEGGDYGDFGLDDRLICRDGADAAHTFVVATYSDPLDPSDDRPIFVDTKLEQYEDELVIDGFHIRKTDWTPEGGFGGPYPQSGYPLANGIAGETAGGGNFVIQNCYVELTTGAGISIAPGANVEPIDGVQIVGCVSTYNEDSGMYLGHCKTISIRGCVFDHNGWDDAGVNLANLFKHNIYVNQSCEPPCEILDCFTSRPSSYGAQPRAGGYIERNVFALFVYSVFNGNQRGPGSLKQNVFDAGLDANEDFEEGEFTPGGNGPSIGGGTWLTKNTAGQHVWINQIHLSDGTGNTGDAANITFEYRLDGGDWTATNMLHPTEESETFPGYYKCELTQAETNGDQFELRSHTTTEGINTDTNVHLATRPEGSTGGWPMEVAENILGEDFFGTAPNKGFLLTTDFAALGSLMTNLNGHDNFVWNRNTPLNNTAAWGAGNVWNDNVARMGDSGYAVVVREAELGDWPSSSDLSMDGNTHYGTSAISFRANGEVLAQANFATWVSISGETSGTYTDPSGSYPNAGACLAQYAVEELGISPAWGTLAEKKAAMIAAINVAKTRDRIKGTGFDTLLYVNWRRTKLGWSEITP
jgi:hypothetical protein